MLERLLAALQQGAPQQQKGGAPSSRLMRAMSRKGDAKYASLPALPPYAEQKHAESYGGRGNDFQGAFQDDAFQDDAYQVF